VGRAHRPRGGETGHVYATEVDHEKLQQVEARVKEDGLKNVTTVLGTQTDTGLLPSCCDAILLRMVYHHFTDPPGCGPASAPPCVAVLVS